jgi:hypothetical protein
MTSQDTVSSTYGVHSEVGRLHKVLVCAPGWPTVGSRPPTPTTWCSTSLPSASGVSRILAITR